MKKLLYFWQLPQNLLGLLIVFLYQPERKHVLRNGTIIFYSTKIKNGISLGKYSIVSTTHYRQSVINSLKRNAVRHVVIGHSKLSYRLGWLYIPIIGFPSFIWCLVYKYTKYNYYWFFTERLASRLANKK